MNTRRIGSLGEDIAAAFLSIRGYEVVYRNYRYAGREIDLVVRKGMSLVAVEVKLRRGDAFGRAVEGVDKHKLARIRLALSAVLSHTEDPVEPRIDLVVLDVGADPNVMTVRHIEAVS